MVTRACPLCGDSRCEPHLSAGDTTFGFPGTFQVVKCTSCGMLFTNPQVAPADIGAFYPADYAAHDLDRAAKHAKARRGKDPWDRLPELGKKRLLDVGCGSGAYLMKQERQGWQAFGVDPAADAVAGALQQGMNAVVGTLPGVELPEREFEVITLLGVLDHVSEPLATLRRLYDLCVPNGRLIISVPNAASAAAALFGSDWPGWDLPRHQNHFTPATLTDLIRRAGFERIDLAGKRRTSRWRAGARSRAATTGRPVWRVLARGRILCSILARMRSRDARSDEVIAVALK